jgi:dTMP kinase
MKFKKKLFISFEGPEASGKSSQIKLLSNFFKKNKTPHLITREPGGTKNSEKLRKIILDEGDQISNTEELLLLMAARLNHINKIIKPALNDGKIVISDRFADSTFVYQGYVNNYGQKKTIDLHKQLLNNFLPNKTFLFLLPTNIINQRLKKRVVHNKYDKIDIKFHQKVLTGYKILSKKNKRFFTLDASKSIKLIHEELIREIIKIK